MHSFGIGLILSAFIYLLATINIFLGKKDVIVVLISLELILLAININFVFFSVQADDLLGQIYGLMVLTIAAGESAVGLAILVLYYRLKGSIFLDTINALKA